ncbi:putative non-specific serine/threonine protein kinase [Rosa chinensis]|uniref:Putative non-specific serine/threonine protein kinase n=1 Tax=Rosa chinensis TaxID=74649 RepID=A0A2P6P3J5_ROSCH|nr:putative non-specific serine/threonine protein kinase [Rosa chinensis]
MSFNTLTGIPLASLFSLPNISYLNLASNLLSGSLPGHLSCGIKLDYIHISNNRFTADLPSCLGPESEERVVNFGGSCLSVSTQNQEPDHIAM